VQAKDENGQTPLFAAIGGLNKGSFIVETLMNSNNEKKR